MSERGQLPPWPADPPAAGSVVLRPFRQGDVAMVRDLARDPYAPLIGTLPANATDAHPSRRATGAGATQPMR